MTRFVSVFIVCFLVGAATAQSQLLDALPDLQRSRWEAHVLRVENATLRAEIADLRAKLDSANLSSERFLLEQEFRDVLKPPTDALFDWSTGRFVKK
jgi:hypothetical protein